MRAYVCACIRIAYACARATVQPLSLSTGVVARVGSTGAPSGVLCGAFSLSLCACGARFLSLSFFSNGRRPGPIHAAPPRQSGRQAPGLRRAPAEAGAWHAGERERGKRGGGASYNRQPLHFQSIHASNSHPARWPRLTRRRTATRYTCRLLLQVSSPVRHSKAVYTQFLKLAPLAAPATPPLKSQDTLSTTGRC